MSYRPDNEIHIRPIVEKKDNKKKKEERPIIPKDLKCAKFEIDCNWTESDEKQINVDFDEFIMYAFLGARAASYYKKMKYRDFSYIDKLEELTKNCYHDPNGNIVVHKPIRFIGGVYCQIVKWNWFNLIFYIGKDHDLYDDSAEACRNRISLIIK